MNVTGLAPVYFGKLNEQPVARQKVQPHTDVQDGKEEGTPFVFFHGGDKFAVQGEPKEHYLRLSAEANGHAMDKDLTLATALRRKARAFLESLVTEKKLFPLSA